MAELAPEVLLTVDHRLRIGSVTKTVTAALLLRLQEDGLVDLDAPISDHVDTPVANADEFRVRQLLNHTSGIANYLNYPGFFDIADGARVWEPAELVQMGVDLGPVFDPGEGWEYSNTNYIIAGLIAEAVTGQTFGQVVRATVLEPAGLDETYFDGEETVEGELAHGYKPGEDLTWTHHPSAAWAAVVVAISNTFGYFPQWDAVEHGLLALDDARSSPPAGRPTLAGP